MTETINTLAPPQSKTTLAQQLGVTRTTLYYQPKLPAKDLALKAEIERVMNKHKAYGHRRIADELGVDKKRIRRVMHIFHLKVSRKRKIAKKHQDVGQKPMAIPNLVLGLTIDRPHHVWVSDFTYLPYYEKFIYLSTVEDVFTRRVLGWAVSTRHTVDLVSQAFLEAILLHPTPTMIHSDQGAEYRSKEYLHLLGSFHIQPSMSQKASPWQNGYQESFFSGFKFELGYPEIYPALGELIEAIAQQIHYYNHERIHTALRCSPVVFATKYQLNQQRTVNNSLIINQEIPVRQSV